MHCLIIVWLDKKGNAQKSLLPTSELYRYKNNQYYSQVILAIIKSDDGVFGGNRICAIRNSYGLKHEQ